jgi:hypothetical protein
MKNLFTVLILLVCFLGQIDLCCTLKKSTVRTIDKRIGETLPFIKASLEGMTVGASVNLDGKYVILCISPFEKSIRFNRIGYQSNAVENIKIFNSIATDQDENLGKADSWLSSTVALNYAERIPKGIFLNHTTVTCYNIKSHQSFINSTIYPSDNDSISSIINILHSPIDQPHFVKLPKQKKVFCFNQLISSKIDEGKYDKTNTSKLIG